MRPETPVDVDEIFRDADVPPMSVDPRAVVTSGRRARRQRRLVGAAGLAATTLVAAVGLTVATGTLGEDGADISPATTSSPVSSAPTTGPSPTSTAPTPVGEATITTVRRGDPFVGTGSCAAPGGCHRPDLEIAHIRPGTYGVRCYADGSRVPFWERPDAVEVTASGAVSDLGGWCGVTDAVSTVKVALFGGPSGTVESSFHPW